MDDRGGRKMPRDRAEQHRRGATSPPISQLAVRLGARCDSFHLTICLVCALLAASQTVRDYERLIKFFFLNIYTPPSSSSGACALLDDDQREHLLHGGDPREKNFVRGYKTE